MNGGENQKYEYFVMDGRANFDLGRAQVLEALGRNCPSDKSLRRDWGQMGAVLVRAPVVSGNCCGDFEFVKGI